MAVPSDHILARKHEKTGKTSVAQLDSRNEIYLTSPAMKTAKCKGAADKCCHYTLNSCEYLRTIQIPRGSQQEIIAQDGCKCDTIKSQLEGTGQLHLLNSTECWHVARWILNPLNPRA